MIIYFGLQPLKASVHYWHWYKVLTTSCNIYHVYSFKLIHLHSSLNVVDGFEVSKNPSIHIQHLVVCPRGVWISMRGSPIITLWDTFTLSCLLVYDTSCDQMPIFKVTEILH